MSFLQSNTSDDIIKEKNDGLREGRIERRDVSHWIIKQAGQFRQPYNKIFINNIIRDVKKITFNYITKDIKSIDDILGNNYYLYLLLTENPGNLHEVDIIYHPDEYDDENDLSCYETINCFENTKKYEKNLTDSIPGDYFNLLNCKNDDFLGTYFRNKAFDDGIKMTKMVKLDELCYNLLKVLLRLDILLLNNKLYDKELQNTIYRLGLLTIHCNNDEYNFVYDAVNIIFNLLKQSSEYDSIEKMRVLIKSLI